MLHDISGLRANILLFGANVRQIRESEFDLLSLPLDHGAGLLILSEVEAQHDELGTRKTRETNNKTDRRSSRRSSNSCDDHKAVGEGTWSRAWVARVVTAVIKAQVVALETASYKEMIDQERAEKARKSAKPY